MTKFGGNDWAVTPLFPYLLNKVNDLSLPEAILESTAIHAIFQKKAKNVKKMGKIFKNMGKNIQNLKIILKKARECMRLSHTINC